MPLTIVSEKKTEMFPFKKSVATNQKRPRIDVWTTGGTNEFSIMTLSEGLSPRHCCPCPKTSQPGTYQLPTVPLQRVALYCETCSLVGAIKHLIQIN